jgi:hypothetical protein
MSAGERNVKGSLRIAMLAAASLVASPFALACENPDDTVSALRDVIPKTVQPGDFVLELDVASMKAFEGAPQEWGADGHRITFVNSYATFDVKRVVAGKFGGAKATILLGNSTCWRLRSPTANYLLAGPEMVGEDGTRFLPTRGMTAAEQTRP